MKGTEKLTAARYWAIKMRPYLASVLMRMPLIESAAVKTMAVDSEWRLYYDPAFVESLTVNELATVMLHEVYHIISRHHHRLAGVPREIAGLAADCAINSQLQAERLPMPGGEYAPILPENFGLPPGLTAEEYVDLLMGSAHQQPGSQGVPGSDQTGSTGDSDPCDAGSTDRARRQGQGDSAPQSPQGQQASDSAPQSPQGQQASDSAPQSPQGQQASDSPRSSNQAGPVRSSSNEGAAQGVQGGPAQPMPDPSGSARPMQGRSGSCAYPDHDPWELPAGEGDPVSPAEQEVLIKEVGVRILERHQARGDVPAGLVRIAQRLTQPKREDWRHLLAAAIRTAVAYQRGVVDYSYRRPSRRQSSCPNIVLPSLRAPIPRVAVILDTSGSIDDGMLGTAIQVVANVLEKVGETQVVVCDAQVHADLQVRHVNQLQQRLQGGGGTDLRVAFDHLARARKKPEVVIVITDGYTPWPDQKPSWAQRVIVATMGKKAPSWAKQVKIGGNGNGNE